jgi:surface protein
MKEEGKLINASPEPVTFEGTKIILNQMNKCVCKIHGKGEGTGFFTKIPFNSQLLPVLITNNHSLSGKDIKNNNKITLSLNHNKKTKEIRIDEDRKIYTSKELDIAIIEIKDNDNLDNEYIDLDDNILNYCKNNNNGNLNYLNYIYNNKSIYILHYQKGNNIVVSYGQPPKCKNSEINHKCSIEYGSSGSPILLINNQKLIGVHLDSYNKSEYSSGILMVHSIIEFQKENNIDDNNISNYIIGEFEIEKDNQKIRIINSYEEFIREKKWEDKEEFHNEEEIKDNCEIRINNKKIPFSYKHEFNKKGRYTIKYIFKNNITNVNTLFRDCKYLVNINLSNFNTQNVIYMGGMFEGCSSLTNINLSNINTKNVTDMHCMFSNCSSLTNLNLSSFNTRKVTHMGGMFNRCSSLTNINLSSFNTQNVTDMEYMFSECSSLEKINLSNFNTQNATDMGYMFSKCSSLANLNLSNFNTQSVTNMSGMFGGCSSLKKEKIITKNDKILNEFKY